MTMPHDPGILRVHVDNATEIAAVPTEEKEAEHITCSTFTLTEAIGVLAAVTPIQILNLDPLRKRAVLNFSGDGQVILAHSLQQAMSLAQNVAQAADEGCLVSCPASITMEATAPLWAVSLANPVALSYQSAVSATPTVAAQAVSTIPTPQSGNYTAYVQVYVDGTTTAADEDNMQISYNGGSQVIPLLVPINVGANAVPIPFTNGPFQIGGINGINTMIIRTSGVPSGTAKYHALVIMIPLANGASDPYVAVGVLQERRDK